MLAEPGSIGFARTTGAMGWLIRLGEWLKFRKCDFNHMFLVAEDGNHIIQATLRGVTDVTLLTEVAPGGGKYITVPLPAGVRAEDVLKFARRQVGIRYGYWTILAVAIDILTWQWCPALRGARKPSWICSALSCEALRYGGWLYDTIDIYTITPEQAYAALS